MAHYDETMGYKKNYKHVFENYDSPQVAFQISELIEAFLDRGVIVTDY
jgi:guanylate kinase